MISSRTVSLYLCGDRSRSSPARYAATSVFILRLVHKAQKATNNQAKGDESFANKYLRFCEFFFNSPPNIHQLESISSLLLGSINGCGYSTGLFLLCQKGSTNSKVNPSMKTIESRNGP